MQRGPRGTSATNPAFRAKACAISPPAGQAALPAKLPRVSSDVAIPLSHSYGAKLLRWPAILIEKFP